MTERLSFGLADSALDYLLSAAEHAKSDSLRSWKYSLLHLTAAIELLIKARLEEEHWSLLFAELDRATQSALHSGDFKSVDFQTACSRLQNIVGVEIPAEHLRHLDQLRKLRNRAQHFTINVDVSQVKSLLASGTSFFLSFLRSYLPEEMAGRDDVLAEVHEHLREFEEFVRTHLSAVSMKLAEAAAVFECPRCWQQTMVIGKGDPYCPFCGFTSSARELAEHIGEGWIDDECLNCGQRTLAFVLYHNEFGVDYCTNCGTKQTMCLRCRHRYIGEQDVCPECAYSP